MKTIATSLLFFVLFFSVSANDYSVKSPSERITVKVAVGDVITYSVLLNGKIIIEPSQISMELNGDEVWGKEAKIKKAKTTSVSQELTPVVQRKYSKILDEYNQLTLSFKGYALQFRAYDEGAAY